MVQVISFPSYEAAMQHIAAATAVANAALLSRQKEFLDPEAPTVKFFWPHSEYGFIVFGEALSLADSDAGNLACYPSVNGGKAAVLADLSPDDREEFDYSSESTKETRANGYVFCRVWSVAEHFEEGTLGDTHALNMWPLSDEAWEEAKASHWTAGADGNPVGPALLACLGELATAIVEEHGNG